MARRINVFKYHLPVYGVYSYAISTSYCHLDPQALVMSAVVMCFNW